MTKELAADLFKWALTAAIAFVVSSYTVEWRLSPLRNVSIVASMVLPQSVCRVDRKALSGEIAKNLATNAKTRDEEWAALLFGLYKDEVQLPSETIPAFIDSLSDREIEKLRKHRLVGDSCKKNADPDFENTVIRVDAVVRVGIEHYYAIGRRCDLLVQSPASEGEWSIPLYLTEGANESGYPRELYVTNRSRYVELRFDKKVSGTTAAEPLADVVAAIRGQPYNARVSCPVMRVDREEFVEVTSKRLQRFDKRNRLILEPESRRGVLSWIGL